MKQKIKQYDEVFNNTKECDQIMVEEAYFQ